MKTLRFCILTLALLSVPFAASAAEGEAHSRPFSMTINKVAAVVNGEIITMHDLRQHSTGELMRAKLDPKDPGARDAINKVMSRVLTTMADNILLRQEAERLKIKATDTEVENEIRKLMQRNQLSPKEFERRLIAQGGTMDMLKERIRHSILSQRILSFMIARKIVITPEEVSKYYDEHKGEFLADKSVDISLLVFAPNATTGDIAKRIRSGSLAFATAVKQYSVGPAKEQGGALGLIRWEDLAQPIKVPTQHLDTGDVSEIFQLNGHDALVKINNITHGRPMTLEEATPEIERVLREPRLQERFDEYMEQLRAKSVIDIRL